MASVFRTQDISGKTVLVTGATAGIGKAIAQGFAECKSRVIISGRRKERLDELEQQLKEKYKKSLETVTSNISAIIILSRVLSPGMVQRGFGHIINISSVAAEIANPGNSVYTGTKFALKGITESVRKDLLKTPVRVTEIRPGWVETEILENSLGKGKSDQFFNHMSYLLPIDIADSVIYAATRPNNLNVNVITCEINQQKGEKPSNLSQ